VKKIRRKKRNLMKNDKEFKVLEVGSYEGFRDRRREFR